MRNVFFVLIFVMLPLAASARPPHGRPPRLDPDMVQLGNDVQAIEGLMRSLKGDPRVLADIGRRLMAMKQRVHQLAVTLPRRAPGVVIVQPTTTTTSPTPIAPPAPVPMDPDTFAAMKDRVAKETWSDDKIAVVVAVRR